MPSSTSPPTGPAACSASPRFVTLRPGLAVPLGIYVIEFAVVDTMLSLGFLAFAVKGPNDMHLVDATLWRWNWSPPAKAVNTASIVLLCLLGHPALASLVRRGRAGPQALVLPPAPHRDVPRRGGPAMNGEGALRVAGPVILMIGIGLVSGLVPLINAEALLIAAVVQAQGRWPAVVVAVAIGQSGAKVLIYLAARDGRRLLPTRWAHRPHTPARPGTEARSPGCRDATRRWAPHADRVAELVRRPVAGSALILASAIGGIPPLAATSVIAGASRMRLSLFGTTCLTGRLVRFTIIAIPVAGYLGS